MPDLTALLDLAPGAVIRSALGAHAVSLVALLLVIAYRGYARRRRRGKSSALGFQFLVGVWGLEITAGRIRMFDLLSVSHFPIESWVAGMWSAFFQSLFVLAVLSTVTLFGGQGVSTPDAEKLIPVVVVVTVLLDWGTLMVFGSPLPE